MLRVIDAPIQALAAQTHRSRFRPCSTDWRAWGHSGTPGGGAGVALRREGRLDKVHRPSGSIDLSEIGIPFDSVRPDATARPQVWDMHALIRFTAIMGPLSSLFDLLTFGGLVFIFHVSAIEFRSTWFLELMATQILVIFIIRTNGRPWKDLPRAALVASSLVAAAWHAGRHRLPGRPLSRLRRASQKGGRGAKRSIVKAVAHNSKT